MDKKKILEDLKNNNFWKKEYKDVNEALDESISDKSIPDFYRALNLIIRTADIMKDVTEQYLQKNFDITLAQKGVLSALYFSGEEYMSQNRLSKFIYTSRANTLSILERMERKELISREENKENKREKKVMLTKKGNELVEGLTCEFEKMPLENILDEKEAQKVIASLLKISKGYKEVLK